MRRVFVELDDDTYAQAARRAANEGLPLAEWAARVLRGLLADAAPVPPLPDGEDGSGDAAVEAPEQDDAEQITRFHSGLADAGVSVRSRLARVAPSVLDEARSTPYLVEVLLFPYQPGEAGAEGHHPVATEIVDLAGAWDGLHYLLSPLRRAGHTWAPADDPFTLALYGVPFGQGMPDLGHGPPGYVPAPAVVPLAAAFLSLTEDDLRAAYNPVEMDARDVYPLAWARDKKEGLEYLLYYFEVLRDFYIRASVSAEAVLLCFW